MQEILGIIPCNAHSFSLFIKPEEMQLALKDVGLNVDGDIRGMGPTFSLLAWIKAVIYGFDVPKELKGAPTGWAFMTDWTQSDDISASFLWSAVKL